MKTLSKSEKARRWLKSGKALTKRQAFINWEFYSFRIFLGRNKDKLGIVNINPKGTHGKYKLKEFIK